ncbi:uncharacterized protein LOC113565549 [Drosophila persimilis]|uniref:uncharacterized protein LOC113565549 n=1 Tax=Drosophila persimilis TaxID=7234 RepID=UPI000F089554|nr:uncharacterized protein LOC113565549 [Drosophila persimilis]
MAVCLASHAVFSADDSAVPPRPVRKSKGHDAASVLLSRASRPLQQRPVIDGGIVGSRPREIMSTIPTLIRRRLKHWASASRRMTYVLYALAETESYPISHRQTVPCPALPRPIQHRRSPIPARQNRTPAG